VRGRGDKKALLQEGKRYMNAINSVQREDHLKVRNKLLRILLPLFSAALFMLALYVLYHELKNYNYHDVIHYFRALPGYRIALAVLCSLLSYLCLTGYDFLGIQYAHHPLKYGKIAFASYTGYAFSNNIGYSFISGGFIRYRLYSAWGLSAVEITKVVALCTLTSFLGYFSVAGVTFVIEGETVPASLHVPIHSVRPVGIVFLGIIAGYFTLITLVRKPVSIKSFEYQLPTVRLSIAQIAISSLDWFFAGSTLYFLLPEGAGVSLPGFLGIYLLAQFAGTASQVPGGLGVFELVMVLLLPSTVTHSHIIGSLLSFRILYYFLPLTIAALLLGSNEIRERREGVLKVAQRLGKRVSVIVPSIFAALGFLAGVVLLFSGALPLNRVRLEWLSSIFPLHFIEGSHFLSSIIGMFLILVARGLQQRLSAAYYITAALMGVGVIFSLMKGFRYEEAILLAVMLAALLPARREFYRKASIFEQRFSPGWTIAIFLVLLSSIWFGLFTHRHVEYSNELWWQFSLRADSPRFLRASVGVGAVILFFALERLFRPAVARPHLPDTAELEKALPIIKRSKTTDSSLALLGDKALLFSPTGNSFLMYGVQGRSWIVFSDPVGPVEEWDELAWRFRELCNRYTGRTVYYEVGQENLEFYRSIGLSILKFGEQGRVALQEFALDGKEFKHMRHTRNMLTKEGFQFVLIPPEEVPAYIPEFRRISEEWLASKHTKEKGFSIGYYSSDYLKRFPSALVQRGDTIVAFANVMSCGEKEELSIDLMRFSTSAPEGVMDYLFIELMLMGKKEGYRWFNLGMVPLSGLGSDSLAPLWDRIGMFIFRHGEYFYNFQGLRQYKEKFNPSWEPRYIAAPGGLILPRILIDVATLVSGGVRGIISR
jgi:phosphatidylglycerol lysyltransferase